MWKLGEFQKQEGEGLMEKKTEMKQNIIKLYKRVPSLVNDINFIFMRRVKQTYRVEEYNGKNELISKEKITIDEVSKYILDDRYIIG